MESVYIETSVIGYLTSPLSGDLVTAAHQRITREWWEMESHHFSLYISKLVYDEITLDDIGQAETRCNFVAHLPQIAVSDESRELASVYSARIPVLRDAKADALHLAISTLEGLEYLLTWNCRHIARASVRQKLVEINTELRLGWPQICTPEELSHGDSSLG